MKMMITKRELTSHPVTSVGVPKSRVQDRDFRAHDLLRESLDEGREAGSEGARAQQGWGHKARLGSRLGEGAFCSVNQLLRCTPWVKGAGFYSLVSKGGGGGWACSPSQMEQLQAAEGSQRRGAGGGAGTRVSGGMGVRAWIRGSRGPTLPVTVHPVHCLNPLSPSASLHLRFCGYQGNTKVTLRRRHGTHHGRRRLPRGTSPSSTLAPSSPLS